MKIRFILCTAACLALAAACSDMSLESHKPAMVMPKPTIRLALLPQDALAPGKPVTIFAKLNNIETRSIITDEQLETVHTKTFHLLIVDPTLTDYQHIHPKPTSTPGLYSFQFTPKLAGGYRAWADITPKATGKQEFAMADLGASRPGAITRAESHEVTVDGYHFTLSFDKAPAAEDESMGTLSITDKSGNAVETLQPVMGSFAHIVGFYDDYRNIVHVHPMGKEPSGDADRGGPELTFHLEPMKPGFIKLFAQVRINNKDIFAPFGVMVGKAQ